MSADTSQNNKRIAKNTILLYFRMLFMMVVSLYTSRVILNALGVEDFGIYNVVGGVVAMFTLISGSLSAAISRFITYELGRGDQGKLNRIFSASVTIQLLLSLIIVVLIETVGVWFLNAKMIIPAERMTAANLVLQFSIITFVINLISVPYNAAIIAHERMSAFAYISILEALFKLMIAFLIMASPIDKLIFYAILMCIVSVVIRLVYGYYCKKHFSECTYHFHWDREILMKMFGFAGWNFIGASSAVLRDQGGNIVLNLFFGPAVNAARGISIQVNNAITGFVQNFMTALNPQITKSYASGDYEYMMKLIFQGARLSFYMLLLLSLPILVNTHYILVIWLKILPDHAVLFVQLTLLFTMSESISNPLITAMLATGRIRNYQIVVGGLQMMNLPVSYICLHMGCMPESVLLIAIIISQCCLAARLYMLRGLIGLSSIRYLKEVYLNVLMVTVLSLIVPFTLSIYLEESFGAFILITLLATACTYTVEFYVGCTKKERAFVIDKVNKAIQKVK
ncbi:MAG: lipopolysaccharide biosynthesis protein [Prevotellaceae bacterium]|nr:lipopolysaccharide biosynthesis protein [Prevotellaceae bacterium]